MSGTSNSLKFNKFENFFAPCDARHWGPGPDALHLDHRRRIIAAHQMETEPIMSRQTRINVAALLLAAPMVLVGLSVTPGF